MSTTQAEGRKNNGGTAVSEITLDYSALVGHDVVLFTEQYKGQPVRSRVVMVGEGCLSIDRGGSYGVVDSLVNNQKVVVQFRYKSQLVSVDAVLKRSDGGRCNVMLEDKVTPLTRRKYRRIVLRTPVKSSVMPSMILEPNRLSRQRWVAIFAQNFSSGGILLSMPARIEQGTNLLLNIELENFDFPALVIGKVKYSNLGKDGRYDTGVEFIVNEEKNQHFDTTLLRKLPGVLFEYDAARRRDLEKELGAWMKEIEREQE